MWKTIKKNLAEVFFPTRCFFCGKYGVLLCPDCESLLDIGAAHRPDRNKKFLADIYSACSYENKFVQKLIRSFKYEPLYRDLGSPLAGLIAHHFALAEQNFDRRDSIIIPVPLARKRLRARGFNQAEIIAKHLGRLWQIPVSSNCLGRSRETMAQAELPQNQRRENIKNAFSCLDSSPLKNKSVFLIDDVVTTGATMNECARVLLKNNARQIIGVSLARTENN